MNKRIFHIISTIIVILLLIISFIRMFFTLPTLPDFIGVHFSNDGTFDVIVSKNKYFYIFYPELVSLIIIIVIEVIFYFLNKLSVGLKINNNDEEKLKLMIELYFDYSIKLIWVIFLSIIWANCIINQNNLNTNIPVIFLYIQIVSTISLLLYILFLRLKNVNKVRKG